MQKEIWVVFGMTSLKLESASLNNTEMLVSPWRTDKEKATDAMWGETHKTGICKGILTSKWWTM